MTKNVTLRRPKLLDLDQLLLWENNLDNSLFSDNPIFYTAEQIEEFLNSDQDIFLDRQIRFMIDSSGSPVGCVDLFEYDMVNSRAGVGIFIDEKFVGERGRINCSLKDSSGLWRWLGVQFVLSDK